MPKAQFYHNAHRPLHTACELAVSAFGSGRKLVIRAADADSARQIDTLLWTFDAGSFIPHVLADSALAAQTPVLITHAGASNNWPHRDVLINLARDPEPCDGFRMLVEIVGTDPEDVLPARSRWKHYKGLGYELVAFDTETRERL